MSADTISIGRSLPHNLEAEEWVIGGIFIDPTNLDHVLELISPEDFFSPKYKKILEAIIFLANKREAIDPIVVSNHLSTTGDLQFIGGKDAISSLADKIPNVHHIDDYCKIIRDKSIRRHLLEQLHKIGKECLSSTEEMDIFLDYAESSIFSVADQRKKRSFVDSHDLAFDTMKKIDELLDRSENITGLETGLIDLDRLTGGLQSSDLIVIAARPGMGKTSIAMSIAQFIAVQKKKPIGLFSLEMSKDQIMMRLLCAEARINFSLVRNGTLPRVEYDRMTPAFDRLNQGASIWIDDSTSLTILDVRARARRLKKEHNIELIIVDYLQLLNGSKQTENRAQEIGEIARGLKALAKELDIPIIALCQLNRQVEQRADKRPVMADIRECVTGDTLVTLASGVRIPIKELVGETPEVLSIDDRGKIVSAKSECVWKVGIRKVYEIQLASGRLIKATKLHKLYSFHGWKEIENLNIGDRIAIARTIPDPQNNLDDKWTDHKLILLGHLIGDGCFLKGTSVRYTTGSEDNSRIVQEAAKKEFGTEAKLYKGGENWHQLSLSGGGNRWHPPTIIQWLKNIGIYNQRSHEKRLPKEIFLLGNAQISLFLRHLWSTDGTIFLKKEDNNHVISYSSTSRDLACDIMSLLLRFNIVARLKKTIKKDYKPNYVVKISGVDNQTKFLEQISAYGKQEEKAKKLLNILKNIIANTNVDTIPKECFSRIREAMKRKKISQRKMSQMREVSHSGTACFKRNPSRKVVLDYANLLNDEKLKEIAMSDIFWDKIIKISPLEEEEEVYDLTVPVYHSWLANDIVSHNSGEIEQASDLVMLLYRADVYSSGNSPDNKAELIIGKHRNGPTGVVTLTFVKEYAKFENHFPENRFDS